MGWGFKWLMLAALCVRSLLPLGLMLAPSPANDGRLTLVICTGHGPMIASLAADGDAQTEPSQTEPAQKQPTSHETCPFTPRGLDIVAADVPPTIEITIRYAAAIYRLDDLHFSETPRPSPKSARGPPHLLS